MGHLLLGNLPRTHRWREVIALVEEEASYEEIAKATLTATRDQFEKSADEPGLVESFWLLTQLPLAAEGEDLRQSLAKLGLQTSSRADLLEIITAVDLQLEKVLSANPERSDLSELARLSLIDSLTNWMANAPGDLLASASESAGRAMSRLGMNKNFSAVSQTFFARYLNRHLMYFLSRELSNHVGPQRTFGDIERHAEFNRALELHTRQVTRIMREFAGGWYSKARFEGAITRRKVSGFLHTALGKISRELLREGSGQ